MSSHKQTLAYYDEHASQYDKRTGFEGGTGQVYNYERYFDLGSTRYHHILDPRTGFPARKSRSVTVLAKDGLTADAYSTAVFVLGPEKGLKLVEDTEGVEAIIVGAKNEVTLSSGLRERVRVIRAPSE